MIFRKVALLAFCIITISMVGCQQKESRIGDQLFKQGKYAEAIKAYDDYLIHNANDIKSIYNKGRAYEELGQYEKALADFTTVTKLEPENSSALSSIGNYYLRKRDFKQSKYFFELAVEANERSAQAWYLLGLSEHKLGNTKEATKHYNAAIGLDKELADAYLNRGVLKALANKKKAACADFNMAKNLGAKEAAKALDKYCK